MSIFYSEGRYLCQGIGQGFNETANGNTQFLLNFKVLAMANELGIFVDCEKQYDRTMYQVINGNTIPFAVDALRRLGFTGASFQMLSPDVEGFHDFANQEFEMWCSHSSYNGKDKENWSVAKGERGAFKIEKPLENKKLRALDNLFGQALKEAPVVQRESSPIAPKPLVSQPKYKAGNGIVDITDDDVPF
jgi:hypothetical protein